MERQPILWFEVLNMIITKVPKLIYRFNAIPVKVMTVFFAETGCNIHTEIERYPEQPKKSGGKKKNKTEGFTLPNFKAHYKSIVIRTIWHGHKERHID